MVDPFVYFILVNDIYLHISLALAPIIIQIPKCWSLDFQRDSFNFYMKSPSNSLWKSKYQHLEIWARAEDLIFGNHQGSIQEGTQRSITPPLVIEWYKAEENEDFGGMEFNQAESKSSKWIRENHFEWIPRESTTYKKSTTFLMPAWRSCCSFVTSLLCWSQL